MWCAFCAQPRRAQFGGRRGADRRSDWLLFLHPDTALEPGWEIEAESFIHQAHPGRPMAAVFRFAREEFGGEARRAEVKASLAHRALFALPYGDQGLLIPRRLYQKIGGYRALPAMEDADIVRRIGRRRLIRLRARAVNRRRGRTTAAIARHGADAAAYIAGAVAACWPSFKPLFRQPRHDPCPFASVTKLQGRP